MAGALLERDAAVASIQAAVDDARAGKGAARFLQGEAGLGKTSLLALSQKSAQGFRHWLGRGSTAEATLPFGILSQAIESLSSTEPSHRVVARPLDSRATAFHTALTALRSAGPVLLALDDLQWADPDSLALLAFLCRRIADWPIVIVGTLRANPPAAINAVRRISAEGDAIIETLEPLTPRAAAELLGAKTGRPVDEETARRAWEASGGNPLLLEHLAANLRSQARLRVVGPDEESPGGYRLLLSRFAGVSPRAFEFARMASVLGTSFRPSDAAALANFPTMKAALALEELARAGLVQNDAQRSAEFVHPLFRQLLYEELPEPARSQYHALAFRILATSGASLNEAATHARLADLSGDPQAVGVLEEAGRLAMAAGAFAQARQHYQAAVETAGDQASPSLLLSLGQAALVSGDLPTTLTAYRRVLALPTLPPEANITARRMLGRALMVAGRHEQAQSELNLAEELALRIAPALAVQVLLDHAGGRWQMSSAGAAIALLARARELARDQSPELYQRADVTWSFVAFHIGDPVGIAVVEAAARAAARDPVSDLGDLAWSWGMLGMWMLVARFTERFAESNRAYDVSYAAAREARMPTAEATLAVSQLDQLMRLGRLDQAIALIARGEELAEVVPISAPWLAVARAMLDFELGYSERSAQACDQAEKLGAPYEGRIPIFWLWLGHIRGRLLLDAGKASEAATVYEQVEQLASRSGIVEPCVVPWVWWAIEAHAAANRIDGAQRLVEMLGRIVAPLPCRWPRAAQAIGMARLAERAGHLDEADASFREGLSLLEPLPMPLAKSEALISYGRFLRIHRHPRQARPYLARALELAARANADRLARHGREELSAAGGRRRHAREMLTPQETRVAQLAGEGLSDKQIAHRLSVSERTVDAHLQHIYGKLGIRSRRELMRQSFGVGEEPLAARATTITRG